MMCGHMYVYSNGYAARITVTLAIVEMSSTRNTNGMIVANI